jgi:hypothetical protein
MEAFIYHHPFVWLSHLLLSSGCNLLQPENIIRLHFTSCHIIQHKFIFWKQQFVIHTVTFLQHSRHTDMLQEGGSWKGRNFSLCLYNQTSSAAHPAYYPLSTSNTSPEL